MTKLSETNSLVYEIFHKTNLYDLILERLLTIQLEVIGKHIVEGTLYNYACDDAFGLTLVTIMMEKG